MINAVNADFDVRQQCYQDLKTHMSEFPQFEEAYDIFSDMEYDQIEQGFSRKYQDMSSFGVDLEEPLFELRLFDEWSQTAYQHPPNSPFPATERTEQRDQPAREYIIAEEYVNEPDWDRHFIWCSFMRINADDLYEVEAENYWYDSEIASTLVESDQNQNRVWYNTNTAFDYDEMPLAEFERLFVYPQATQNDFFDKYSIKEAFPTNVVSYDEFTGAFEEDEEDSIRGVVYDEEWNIDLHDLPDIMSTLREETDHDVFPYFEFYQEIENNFPEFARYLAVNWIINFDTLKEAIAERHEHEFADLWSVIVNQRDLDRFAYMEEQWEDIDMDDDQKELYRERLEQIDEIDAQVRERLWMAEREETDITQGQLEVDETDEEEQVMQEIQTLENIIDEQDAIEDLDEALQEVDGVETQEDIETMEEVQEVRDSIEEMDEMEEVDFDDFEQVGEWTDEDQQHPSSDQQEEPVDDIVLYIVVGFLVLVLIASGVMFFIKNRK